ncbi:acetyl-CoA carboxylase biotin carboxylase subunit [Oceanobacillus bengalensis]|uniref:biotin carboxylase n=1 Tax=Oceanobacillus bengalensis TaxID=1435466 RepID=A0A494YST7_9BACI|nr:acetyl-CoA carboxylase biotin carboxylase subunit [Oceanobacillus bengalensis]RKQ13153.1 acetyl-CoA carboxylase biotin carboxylase subunit [Oceanobacillus bengalensis]
MINKILIANRGEIAARIIRTCKKRGIRTIAIYSEADKDAPHVQLADESACVGKAPVNESYLNSEKILAIAKEFRADAIHPGYGFLSENDTFASLCRDEGFIFIGPKSNVIQKMGDKIEARKAMKAAGVPVVPGTEDAAQTAEEAVQLAGELGYPVMLKASAGGGGIGMQVVHSEEELVKAFENNSKRALSFFGNGAMFLEKKIENARHIEIQILADEHGNVVHLFERECSIQRRNQKVIEEAPSTFISDETRKKMGNAAVQAAKAIGYTNAGTIEFLVDKEENFYFLEMNTRIQVEHPVTEEITGIDIVAAQISIAQGNVLEITQEGVTMSGHSIEARIYAENPDTFFPSPGHISHVTFPRGQHVRNEVAIRSDYDVTPFYDPMIAKLIVKASTREEAIIRLKEALEVYKIEGIKTNIPMLLKVIKHEAFVSGNTTTAFVETYIKK